MHVRRLKSVFLLLRVLTDARDAVRTQTARSTKSSKSIFRAFKGLRAANDVEEIAALEAKISAALERFQVCVHLPPSVTDVHVHPRLNHTFGSSWSLRM
jgi:hypothetical protein